MHDFRRLIAWQKANAFELRLQPIIDRIAAERPVLADQLERSSSSIAANISEGCGRESKRDFRHYLTMAIGSTTETENHLIRAHQRGLITTAELESLTAACAEIRKVTHGLRKSIS
jgi:four helix bundle protein